MNRALDKGEYFVRNLSGDTRSPRCKNYGNRVKIEYGSVGKKRSAEDCTRTEEDPNCRQDAFGSYESREAG
jgi:hypothetical protein